MPTIFDQIVGKTIAKTEWSREEKDGTTYLVFITFTDGTSIDIRAHEPMMYRTKEIWIRFPVFHGPVASELRHL